MLAEKITARPHKPVCRNGHWMVWENVMWVKVKGKHHRQVRYPICRLCRSVSQREYARRKASR